MKNIVNETMFCLKNICNSDPGFWTGNSKFDSKSQKDQSINFSKFNKTFNFYYYLKIKVYHYSNKKDTQSYTFKSQFLISYIF